MAEQGVGSGEDLVAFVVRGWTDAKLYSGLVGPAPGPDSSELVRLTRTNRFGRPGGGSLSITVRRPTSRVRREDAALDAMVGAHHQSAGREHFDFEAVRGHAEQLSWNTATIDVDEVVTHFEVVALALGRWIAITEQPRFQLILEGVDVSMSEVQLVRATGPAPP